MRKEYKRSVRGALCIAWTATTLAGSTSAGPIDRTSLRVIEASSLTEHIYYRRYNGGHYRYYYIYPRYTYPDAGYASPRYIEPSYAYPNYAEPSYGYQRYDPTYWHRYPWRYGP